MIDAILSSAAIILGAPLLLWIINKTKAIVAGRRGPALLQQYFDIVKMLRKGSVVSSTTTWLFLAGPAVAISAAIVAALLLPLAGRPAWIAFPGDMIVFIYVFALARFFVASAAMDTGSPFEGMGAAREVTFSALAEPALFFGLLAFARLSGSLSLSRILDLQSSHAWRTASASIVLIIVSWFIVLLAENARVPVDDPNTHLELTMIHEVMVLDHGGPPFALIVYGAALKLMVFTVLLVAIIVPMHAGNVAVNVVSFFGAVAGVGIAIGLVESSMARLRLLRIPQLLVTATLLSAFGVVLLLR